MPSAMALHVAQPILRLFHLLARPAVEAHDLETAFGKEEAVRFMSDLLPREIPEMHLDRVFVRAFQLP